MRRGKQYREKAALIDRAHAYPPDEAVRLTKQCAFAKFDETVELHVRTGLDPRHAEQQLRGTVLLPHGLGKPVRVLVFAEGEAARAAAEGVGDARPGRVEFRLDRPSLLHAPIGKASFDEEKLLENLATLVQEVVKAKPTGGKGIFIRTMYLTTTMGPGIRLDLGPTLSLTAG